MTTFPLHGTTASAVTLSGARAGRLTRRWRRGVSASLIALGAIQASCAPKQVADSLVYSIQVSRPDAQVAEVTMSIPSADLATVDVFMPRWSPGYYRVEDYAEHVRSLAAQDAEGRALEVERVRPNRWRVVTRGASRIVVSYQLLCTRSFVTGNWVSQDLGVLTGPATFLAAPHAMDGPHEVQVELPPSWPRIATSLAPAGDGSRHRYRADSYDALVDAPFLAGDLEIHEFLVDGVPHQLVDVGERGSWDGARVAEDLQRVVRQALPLWGELPYERYVFLNVFRPGAGGLEHASSTLLTTNPDRVATEAGYRSWLSFAAHEYFHAFNVKRLRPVELGPFDYEEPPRTPSLWFSEGVTSYYGNLLMARAGLLDTDAFLGSLSSTVRSLQRAPGRLLQTLEQSSLHVWTNSNSGVAPAASTVSYYVKGQVVGFLLDAEIRRLTDGRGSLDDVMRAAYRRYGGARGFAPEDLVRTTEEVAGADLEAWFHRALASTEELDYAPALEWYGLELARDGSWTLKVGAEASAQQAARLRALTAPAG